MLLGWNLLISSFCTTSRFNNIDEEVAAGGKNQNSCSSLETGSVMPPFERSNQNYEISFDSWFV